MPFSASHNAASSGVVGLPRLSRSIGLAALICSLSESGISANDFIPLKFGSDSYIVVTSSTRLNLFSSAPN